VTITDQYQQQTDALATTSAAQVAAVYAALQAGQITAAEAEQLIAAVINAANATASTLADAYVSAQIEQATGVPTPTVGLPPVDDTDRLTLAAKTILDDLHHEIEHPSEDVQPADTPDPTRKAGLRFERLAHSEPLETAQHFSIEVMNAQPLVEGWTRQMDADPCQLCVWWWREGRIWPKDHPFQSHKGCNCQPKVVLAEHIQSTQFTRRLERNRA
jgi:hypothetical protein